MHEPKELEQIISNRVRWTNVQMGAYIDTLDILVNRLNHSAKVSLIL